MSTGERPGEPVGDYRQLFHDSYLRCVVSDQDGFFKRFYELFTGADDGVAEAFAHTKMERQISMLQESLLTMIDFSNSRIGSDRLNRIASHHGSKGMDIPSRLFDLWMDCLVETARERDGRFDSQIEAAWRVSLAPGIAFLKLHCSR